MPEPATENAPAPAPKVALSGDVELPAELARSGNVRGTLSGDRRDIEAAVEWRRGTLSGDEGPGGAAAARATLSGEVETDVGGASVRGTLSGEPGGIPGEGAIHGTLSGEGTTLSGDAPIRARRRGAAAGGEPGADSMAEGLSAFDYEVRGQLGKGGMGIVWTATQRSLRRPVAVKTLRPELLGGAAAAKFAAEAMVTGRLEHPNIPPVHGYGHDDQGRPYLSMKLVKGVEWGKLLDPRSPDEKARAARLHLRDHLGIIRKVCEAVAFAHAHGVIHRDLKPENVMVGEFGEVLVMDWGIALDLERRGKESAPSGPRRPIGTPAYLPPEMALADDARMGPWTDVYLVGGLLYELLTGTPPHEGDSVLAVLLAAQKGEVEPPARRAKGRAVPERLAEIAMRCLDPDPQRRYRSAREVEDAIEEYIANEASLKLSAAALQDLAAVEEKIAARSGAQSEVYVALASVVADLRQAGKLWTGNRQAKEGLVRARLCYAGFALDQGDLALAEAQLGEVPADEPSARPLRERVLAMRRAREAEALRRKRMRGLVVFLFIAILGLGVKIVFEVRRADQSEAARALREKAQEAASGSVYAAYPERIAMFKEALAIDGSWAEGWGDLGRTYESYSYDFYREDNPEETRRLLDEAIRCLGRSSELDPENASTISDRAYVYEMAGDAVNARAEYERAVRAGEKSSPSWESACVLAFFAGDFPLAVSMSTRSIEIRPGETDYFRRGIAKFVLGDLDGALADARKAEQLATAGEDEWYHAEMALIYLAKGDARDAGERILRGLRYHPRGPHVLPLAAYHAARMGDLERAKALEARAKERWRAYEKAWLAYDPMWRVTRLAKPPFDVIGRAMCLDLDVATVLPADPPECYKLRKRGEQRFARGEYELALSDAERALGEDPADGNARLLRGRCLIEFGHLEQGRSDLSVVERLAPNRAADVERAFARYEERKREAGSKAGPKGTE